MGSFRQVAKAIEAVDPPGAATLRHASTHLDTLLTQPRDGIGQAHVIHSPQKRLAAKDLLGIDIF
ncbi:MAG: hypothetical protein HZB64_10750 [Rhodocyclales bacterium]|nr:hypothetical protein [Rhodocyclales bacterium]